MVVGHEKKLFSKISQLDKVILMQLHLTIVVGCKLSSAHDMLTSSFSYNLVAAQASLVAQSWRWVL